ncbi:MAG: phosphatidylglycerophosphatase A [Phycisphaerae bacterium]|nr:phosphatidylglycerophosphatase A [Phycisphaerae bacterium]
MKRLLASCFGLGRLPVAPGSWGSLPPVVLFALMSGLGLSAAAVSVVMAICVLLGSVICIKFAPFVIAATGKTDPSEVVIDEFAGQAVTFLFIASAPIKNFWTAAMLGFLFFRFFDILKPWPIRKLEKLHAGWGILADDLLAGVFAGITSLFCLIGWSNLRLAGEL